MSGESAPQSSWVWDGSYNPPRKPRSYYAMLSHPAPQRVRTFAAPMTEHDAKHPHQRCRTGKKHAGRPGRSG